LVSPIRELSGRPSLDAVRDWAASAVPSLAVLVVFACAWGLQAVLADAAFYGSFVITDIPVYQEHGDRIVAGAMPYRDVALEYPPLALPIFLLPYLLGAPVGDTEAYESGFEAVMLLVGLGAVALVLVTVRAMRVQRRHLVPALALVALAPLLVGPILASRYDLWPAALTAGAIAAAVSGRERLAAGGLGLATMAKVYPIVILPLLLAFVWRRRGRREAVRCAAIAIGVMAAVLAPFAIVAPEGLIEAVARQVGRPLQVESLGAAIILVASGFSGMPVTIETSAGSQNLAGAGPDAMAILLTLVQVGLLAGLWWWFARRRRDVEAFVLASALAVSAYVAFGKVLSPQYVVWLVPLVPLVGGRRGLVASGALLVALLLTQGYFPARYFALVEELDPGVATTVLLRDVALVAVVGSLVVPWDRAWVGATAKRERIAAFARTLDPVRVLVVVMVIAGLLHVVWLREPGDSLIFDEAYYVNASRTILGWPVPADAAYAEALAGLDPNTEHPPLGKVAMAASMAVFGDNGLGWRLPSVIAGLIGTVALYLIVRRTGGGIWLGILAVAIFSLDNLAYVHGRIGTLDAMALGAMLVGAWLGLAGRPVLAGTAFAIGCLVKVTAIFGLVAFLVIALVPAGRRLREGGRLVPSDLRDPLLAVGAAALVGIGGLWLLDLRFTEFSSPVDHVRHMLGYGVSLSGGPRPGDIASYPWDWVLNQGGFDYLRIDVNTMADEEIVSSRASVHFQALLNPVLIGAAWLVVPFAAFLAVRRGDALARWGLVWIAANFLPFVALVLVSQRIMYFYYILPVVPALAALTAVFLVRANLPRMVVVSYLVVLVVTFIGLFPFRQVP
jgi:4-amino-4-deoxy-L-arabinose transferase-like glycosyltransferase